MNKEQLIARAEELEIEVPDGATNAQISDLIKIAEHPIISKGLQITQDELEGQKELTEKATQERDAETEKLGNANELIAALEEKLALAIATPEVAKGEIYKNENGEFELTVDSFRFKGEKYIASEAVGNSELMEQLIEAKASFVKEV